MTVSDVTLNVEEACAVDVPSVEGGISSGSDWGVLFSEMRSSYCTNFIFFCNFVFFFLGVDVTYIDYRCEDGRFPVFASCVTISNPGSLSRSETGVNPGI
jgi:hypothetical protein